MPDVLTLTLNPAVDRATTVARVVPGHKLRCAPPLVHPGGGGINVARVVARLGAGVLALHAAGGPAGELLGRLLHAEGVPAEVLPIAGTTRENLAVSDAATGAQYRFVLPGPELAPGEWRALLDRAVELARDARLVVASGSLPPGVPHTVYAQLSARLGPGARVLLDTAGPALRAALDGPGVFAIKPSLGELRELTGEALADPAAQLGACRALVHAGRVAWVALSLGADGALLVTAAGAWRAAGLRVPVLGTIGAGDSFVAGLACALVRGAPPAQALREAMAASTAAVQARGTALGDARQVQALLSSVHVTPA